MKSFTPLTSTVAALALFSGAPAFADAHADAHNDAQADATHETTTLPVGPEGPALWKVADEDTTIYLFGTIHLLAPGTKWYDAEIAGALNSADTVVTEVKMDPQSELAMQQIAMQRGMFTDGTTLRSLLTPEQTTAYEGALSGLGVPAAAFDAFEPWIAGLTLTMLPLMQQGYDSNAGVDRIILAKAGSKPAEALETAEFQLGLFDGLPQEKQVAFLMEAIESMPDAAGTLDAVVGEWVEGDADGLAVLMNEGLNDPELAEALLYTRNANWADWIDARLDTPGTVFIAVGAGHLAGERSVQDYLSQRDIETMRVQ